MRRTPHQNGVVDRMNKTLTEKARRLRLNASLSKGLWATPLNMTFYLVNKSPRALLDAKVAKEVWIGNPISLSNLRIYGCQTYVHISSENQSKLDLKSKPFIFISYHDI